MPVTNMDVFGPYPLSSVRLFVPPLRLVSATLWRTIERGDAADYGLVEEFVTKVLDVIPGLMSYREKVQVLMGLRARLVLEACRPGRLANPEAVQTHLSRMTTCSVTHRREESPDPEVEASESQFLKLIQTLLEDPAQTEHFFQNVFPEEFGPRYDFALQTLLWEFFSRLDVLIPTTTLKQMASLLSAAPFVLEEVVQSVCHLEPLRTLLLSHSKSHGHFETTGLSSDENYILYTLSLSVHEAADRPAVQPDPQADPQTDPQADPQADPQTDPQADPQAIEADPELQSQRGQTPLGVPASPDSQSEQPAWPEAGHTWGTSGQSADQAAGVQTRPSSPETEPQDASERGDERTDGGTAEDGDGLAFHCPHDPRGLGTRGQTVRHSREPPGVSRVVTACLLRQPEVGLDRLDLADERFGPGSSSPRERREREEVQREEEERRHSQRGGAATFLERKTDFSSETLVPSHAEGTGVRGPIEADGGRDAMTTSPARDGHAGTRPVETDARQAAEESSGDAGKRPRKCSACDQTFRQAKAFAAHVSSAHPEMAAKATCRVCHRIFSSQHRMKGHLLSRHDQLLYRCLDCGGSFNTKIDSDRHAKGCKMKLLPCSDCGEKFDPSEAALVNVPLRRNACRIGLGKDFRTCLLCSAAFADALGLAEHLKLRHGLDPYPCLHCGRSFPTAGEQKEHLRGCASPRKCPSCRRAGAPPAPEGDLEVDPEGDLEGDPEGRRPGLPATPGGAVELSEKLQRSDSGGETTSPRDWTEGGAAPPPAWWENSPLPHPRPSSTGPARDPAPTETPPPAPGLNDRTCPHCWKSFAKREYMKQHVRLIHPTGPHRCPACARCFDRPSDLAKHRALKTGCGPNHRNRLSAPAGHTANFRCPHCNALFKTERKLKNHMVYHTGDGFSCKYCGKMFNSKTGANLHLRSHVDRRHLCETCGKGFPTVHTLRNHLPSHSDERPFACGECGKRYKTKCSLQCHYRVHTGERPFPCSVCQVRCTTQSGLTKHMMTHDRDTYFKCEKCGKSYTQKSYLKFHACSSTHTGTLSEAGKP